MVNSTRHQLHTLLPYRTAGRWWGLLENISLFGNLKNYACLRSPSKNSKDYKVHYKHQTKAHNQVLWNQTQRMRLKPQHNTTTHPPEWLKWNGQEIAYWGHEAGQLSHTVKVQAGTTIYRIWQCSQTAEHAYSLWPRNSPSKYTVNVQRDPMSTQSHILECFRKHYWEEPQTGNYPNAHLW